MDGDQNPLPVYFTAADVARELGISRSAVSGAAQRGSLEPDAELASGTPLFSSPSIDRYRANHLGKVGRRSGLKEEREAKMAAIATGHSFKLWLRVEWLRMLTPGLKAAIESLDEQIAQGKKFDLDCAQFEEKRGRLAQILGIHEREIELGRDVNDSVSVQTLLILMAAAELSARLEEGERLQQFLQALPNASSDLVEQFYERAKNIRKVFPLAAFKDAVTAQNISDQLLDWGFPETGN